MAAIYKFQLEVCDRQAVKVPMNTTFISAQEQNGVLCLWAFVNPDNPRVEKCIRIIGTGHELEPDFMQKNILIGTVQNRDSFVWHVFEEISEPASSPI